MPLVNKPTLYYIYIIYYLSCNTNNAQAMHKLQKRIKLITV